MSVLKNVRCSWASLQEPNTKFDPCWEILAHVDEEQAAGFAAKGVKVKTEEDGTKSVRFKLKVSGKKKDGGVFTRDAPEVIDASKNPFKELIGNGSLVNIQYNLREWEMMGNVGFAVDLQRVQVIEHVPFTGGGKTDELEDEGATKVLEEVKQDSVADDSPF